MKSYRMEDVCLHSWRWPLWFPSFLPAFFFNNSRNGGGRSIIHFTGSRPTGGSSHVTDESRESGKAGPLLQAELRSGGWHYFLLSGPEKETYSQIYFLYNLTSNRLIFWWYEYFTCITRMAVSFALQHKAVALIAWITMTVSIWFFIARTSYQLISNPDGYKSTYK